MEQCQHFYRHCVLDHPYAAVTDCGHCRHPRLKHRRADQPACAHYMLRDGPPSLPDRRGTLHFLTTEFLQFILSLELPPEIP